VFRSALPLFEIARLPVGVDHVARFIVNANLAVVRPAIKLRVADCVANRIRPGVPQATERERIGNQIDAATIFARSDFTYAR
jgi:hypothetical protein